MEKKKMSPVVKEVRESLGRDYHRVLTWYHIIHPHIKRMRDEHYQEMAREWKLCKAVEGMIEIDEESSLSTCTVEEQYLERTYRFFTMLFNGDKLAQRNDSEREHISLIVWHNLLVKLVPKLFTRILFLY